MKAEWTNKDVLTQSETTGLNSKAVMVIDMPKDCPFCPLSHWNKLDVFTGCDAVGGKRYAVTDKKGYAELKGKPDWCPLRPLPERKETRYGWQYQGLAEEYRKEGWNTCLDVITGDEE